MAFSAKTPASAFVRIVILMAVAPGCVATKSVTNLDGGASSFALQAVAEVALPGSSSRFDYQDIDSKAAHLIIAHMGDNAVDVLNVDDGSVVARVGNIDTPRGVAVATEPHRIFVTSMPNQVVILDGDSLKEISRVITGAGPDGIAWDPVHKVVGVSDQRDGALSILTDSGQGARTQVPLGTETGNVVFDSKRSLFWITVVRAQGPDALVAIDPTTASITAQLELPGCNGAHGLRLHPNGNSALIACEGNSLLARVELEGAHTLVTARVGDGPDVLAVDSGLQRLYVAAEAGDLNVFDLSQPGLALLNSQRIGDNAHSVGVDSATHRVFFPLSAGSQGKPTLRIMRPSRP